MTEATAQTHSRRGLRERGREAFRQLSDRFQRPPAFWSPPRTTVRARPGSPSLFVTLSQIVGVVVSLTAFVYIAGGAVLWIRLFRSDLPADSVVTSLPRELVVGVGLKSVVVPTVVLGFVAAAGLAAVTVCLRVGRRNVTHGVIALALGFLFFGVALVAVRGASWAVGWVAVACMTYFAALGLGYLLKLHEPGFWSPVKIAIFAIVFGLVGAGIRVGLEFKDPSLDYAVVCVNDGGAKYDGLLIGEAGQAVYMGQGSPGDRVVVSIPMSRVDELWIGSDKRACSARTRPRDGPR